MPVRHVIQTTISNSAIFNSRRMLFVDAAAKFGASVDIDDLTPGLNTLLAHRVDRAEINGRPAIFLQASFRPAIFESHDDPVWRARMDMVFKECEHYGIPTDKVLNGAPAKVAIDTYRIRSRFFDGYDASIAAISFDAEWLETSLEAVVRSYFHEGEWGTDE